MFKICLIGCGQMAESGHGPSVRKYAEIYPDTELTACCDVNFQKAKQFQKKFGFQKFYTDYMEMIDKERPDVALAITPVEFTEKISKDVIRTRTNILLEKPPGLNQKQAYSIHECAIKNKVHARVAFNRRYMPIVADLRREIEAAEKPILHIDCNFIRIGRTDDDFCTTAIHAIDSVKYIAGSDYKQANFTYQDMNYDGKKITNFYVNAQFENSVTAHINFLPCAGCVAERIHVSCEDYTFFAKFPVWNGIDMPGNLVCITNGATYKTLIGEKATLFESNGFYDENASFFEEIRQGKPPFSDVASGIQSVEIADCLRSRVQEFYKTK